MALETLIDMMDVPDSRKRIKPGNVTWLIANLGARNANHPKYREAMRGLYAIALKANLLDRKGREEAKKFED